MQAVLCSEKTFVQVKHNRTQRSRDSNAGNRSIRRWASGPDRQGPVSGIGFTPRIITQQWLGLPDHSARAGARRRASVWGGCR